MLFVFFFFFQAEDGIRDFHVTGVQTCALPICHCCAITCTSTTEPGFHEVSDTLPDGFQIGAGPSPAPAPWELISEVVPNTASASTITDVAAIHIVWSLAWPYTGGPSSSSPSRRRHTVKA